MCSQNFIAILIRNYVALTNIQLDNKTNYGDQGLYMRDYHMRGKICAPNTRNLESTNVCERYFIN